MGIGGQTRSLGLMKLLLAFAALVCVEGFAPAAAPSMLSRSKVAARPQAVPTMGIGGEGPGLALGANEPSLLAVLLIIPVGIGILFAGWQGYQDDDDDFFDTYDSRREDREITNRNRV